MVIVLFVVKGLNGDICEKGKYLLKPVITPFFFTCHFLYGKLIDFLFICDIKCVSQIKMSFKLNNKINFRKDLFLLPDCEIIKYIKEIQKKIPEYLDCIAEEWEASKNTDNITITTTLFALEVLLKDCGFYKSFRLDKNKKVVVKICAYDDDDDSDIEEEDRHVNPKQIFFEIEDEDEIPTIYLENQNELVSSLYYFIKHF